MKRRIASICTYKHNHVNKRSSSAAGLSARRDIQVLRGTMLLGPGANLMDGASQSANWIRAVEMIVVVVTVLRVATSVDFASNKTLEYFLMPNCPVSSRKRCCLCPH
jgi:hypothetical protein